MKNWYRNFISKAIMATLLQALGAAAIASGVGVIYWPAGLIIAGVFLILFGLAAERK
jgi:hypothetical protein